MIRFLRLRNGRAVNTIRWMERSPLVSRAILSAGYDATSQTLELEFGSGRIYRFERVPRGVYEWLLRAPSKGGYVTRMINDRYPYRDVTPTKADDAQDLAETLRASLRVPGREEPQS